VAISGHCGRMADHKLDAGGFILQVHQYLNQYVQVGDAKAAALLAASGGAALLAVPTATYPIQALHWLTVAVFGTAVIYCALILYPRQSPGQKGLIYWENVVSYPTDDEYANAMSSKTPAQLEAEFAKQAWHLSLVLSKKYARLRIALALFMYGSVLGLGDIITSHF